MPLKTKLFDVADYLTTEEDIKAYLDEALASGDSRLVAAALGDVARAKGMTKLLRKPVSLVRAFTNLSVTKGIQNLGPCSRC